jgi:chemotaxis protein methyltransferase CheR
MLERARAGCYGSGSLRDLPRDWLPLAFEERNGLQCVRDRLREHVEFIEQDIRLAIPGGPFDLILCRNLAFTYFDHAVQEEVGAGMVGRLHPGGVLAIGIHEQLPATLDGLQPIAGARALFRKMDTAAA